MVASAKVIAGVGVGGVVLGIVIGATLLYFITRSKRATSPAQAVELMHLKLIRQQLDSLLLDFKPNQLHWGATDLLDRFHSAVQRYVFIYLRGSGTNPDKPYESSVFASLVGPHEGWDHLPQFDNQRRDGEVHLRISSVEFYALG